MDEVMSLPYVIRTVEARGTQSTIELLSCAGLTSIRIVTNLFRSFYHCILFGRNSDSLHPDPSTFHHSDS